jgi:hypothetical protein
VRVTTAGRVTLGTVKVMKPLRSLQGRWISKPNWMCNQGFQNKQVDQEKVDGKNNEKETHPLAWLGKQEEDSSGFKVVMLLLVGWTRR